MANMLIIAMRPRPIRDPKRIMNAMDVRVYV